MYSTSGPRPRRLTWKELRKLTASPLAFGEEIVGQNGDMVHIKGWRCTDIYIVSGPDHIRDILVKKHGKFYKSRKTNRLRPLLGTNLFTSESADHARQRRLIQRAFTADRLGAYTEATMKYCRRMEANWPGEGIINIFDEMSALASKIIADVVLGIDSDNDASGILDALTTIQTVYRWYTGLPFIEPVLQLPISFPGITMRIPLPYRKKVKRARDILYASIGEILRQHEISATDHGDMLSALVGAPTRDESDSPQRFTEYLVTLLLSGSETMASALTWTLYLLSVHPAAQERMRAELRASLNGLEPAADNVGQLTYTRHVFAEALRLFPPVFVLWRTAVEKSTVADYSIPAGANVAMSQHIVHRNPLLYENPDRFNPDRFASHAYLMNKEFSYFPFGGGPHRCIGEPFAWLEGTLILAAVVGDWKFQPVSSLPPGTRCATTLRPRRNIYIRLQAAGA